MDNNGLIVNEQLKSIMAIAVTELFKNCTIFNYSEEGIAIVTYNGPKSFKIKQSVVSEVISKKDE